MITLRTLLGDYPHTKALLNGQVSSAQVKLDFAPVNGRLPFKDFVREHKFDIGELALIPLLQARELNKPFVLIPVVLMGQFQHRGIYVRADTPPWVPADLEGRRVGVRSDAQTGVVWALGILANDYGVDLDTIEFVTFEDPHIAEHQPSLNVERAPPGKELVQTLLDGEVDAIISDFDLTDETRLRPLLANYESAALQWHKKHGVLPAGHVLVASATLSREHPEIIREVFQMFNKSKALASPPKDGIDFHPIGVDALHDTIEMMIDYAVQQRLISRRLTVDEVYDETTRDLRL